MTPQPRTITGGILIAVVVMMTWIVGVESAPRKRLSRTAYDKCELAVKEIPGMNPLVRTDERGLSCRINITTQVCIGSCETFEEGTHEFPFRLHSTFMCAHSGAIEEEFTLTDCDVGAAPHIRKFKVLRATSCACQRYDRLSKVALI